MAPALTNLVQLQGSWIITATQTVSLKNLGIVITGKTVQWTDPQYASEVLCTTSNDMDIMLNTCTLLSVDNNQALWKEASASSFVTVWTRVP